MQVKNNKIMQAILAKRWIVLLVKCLVTGFSLLFLYRQFRKSEIDLQVEYPELLGPVLILVLVMMGANWYLEILRWRSSVQPFEKIGFRQAASDVLGGLALNWMLPFTVGDFVARLAAKKDKFKATSAIMLNRSMMLLLTVIIGSYGLSRILETSFQLSYNSLIVLGLVLIAAIIFRKFLQKFLAYFQDIDKELVLQIVYLSVLRYLVFVLQFFILLKLFVPTMENSYLIAGIGWVFLVRSSIPSMLGGVGLREASAYLFFHDVMTEISLILIPVFLLWVINTVLPSLAGLVLIWKLKITK